MRFFRAIIGLFFSAGLCLTAPAAGPELVFNDLAGVPRHPLEAADKEASVLIFYWQDCPISNGYAPELNRIAAAHTNVAFYIVQVDPGLSRAMATEHARQFDLHQPVLLDPQHRLVVAAGAKVTPEAVVFGRSGQVLYRGRIDDQYAALGKKRAAVRQHDLSDALDAIAAGNPVKPTETEAIGCSIQ